MTRGMRWTPCVGYCRRLKFLWAWFFHFTGMRARLHAQRRGLTKYSHNKEAPKPSELQAISKHYSSLSSIHGPSGGYGMYR